MKSKSVDHPPASPEFDKPETAHPEPHPPHPSGMGAVIESIDPDTVDPGGKIVIHGHGFGEHGVVVLINDDTGEEYPCAVEKWEDHEITATVHSGLAPIQNASIRVDPSISSDPTHVTVNPTPGAK